MQRLTPRICTGLFSACAIAAVLVQDHAWPSAGLVLLAQPPCVAPRPGPPAPARQDALARLLASSEPCPRDVLALRTRIRNAGGAFSTAFINNRGFHNPGDGSFSLFEMVTGKLTPAGDVREGEFFFGHFTGAAGKRLVLNQSPQPGNLMVEVIAWDPAKGMFNFYELLGNGKNGTWSYNGDSQDILIDTEPLHRARAAGRPPFGNGLRCAGCHVNGGPIMKELASPQNDWWTDARKIDRGGREFDAQLAAIASGFVDGDRLSAAVRAGVEKLNTSPQFKAIRAGRSLQEQLRPLFCPIEINFESDVAPLEANGQTTRVPSALFADPRLAEGRLEASRADYDSALQTTGSAFDFPETKLPDADHGWLGPVKATSDQIIVQGLVDAGVIDAEFVSDVLAVDFTNPALSGARCGLLKLVPASASGDWPSWISEGAGRIDCAGGQGTAGQLHDAGAQRRGPSPTRDPVSRHLPRQAENAPVRDLRAETPGATTCGDCRQRDLEEACGPRRFHEILEPDFRVIFPTQKGTPAPNALKLSDSCEITQ